MNLIQTGDPIPRRIHSIDERWTGFCEVTLECGHKQVMLTRTAQETETVLCAACVMYAEDEQLDLWGQAHE